MSLGPLRLEDGHRRTSHSGQVRKQRIVVGAREVAIRRPQVWVVQGTEVVAPLGQGMQDASVGRRDLPPAASVLQGVQNPQVRREARRHRVAPTGTPAVPRGSSRGASQVGRAVSLVWRGSAMPQG